jgi:uncharacterized protein RhaS with RHS repeats
MTGPQLDIVRKDAAGIGGWNRYGYAANNPSTFVDRSGRSIAQSQALKACGSACSGSSMPEVSAFIPCSFVYDPIIRSVRSGCISPGARERGENEWTRRAKEHAPRDREAHCRYLDEVYRNASGPERQKIKQAQKFLGCRHSRSGADEVQPPIGNDTLA